MEEETKNNGTVILGAGLAGLSTAYHLKGGCSLYEQAAEPGGMARTIEKDGYKFDYDGHLLHFRHKQTFSLVSKLLDGNMAPHKRNSWIYSKGSYTRYPFQANFYGLPRDVVKDCLVGLIKAKSRTFSRDDKKGIPENFEHWIRGVFGEGIARHFMLSYNRKFWTVDPSQLTCEWLDGFVPVPELEDVITGAISSNTKQFGYNSTFWYPLKGGISELVKGFLKGVDHLQLNKKVTEIDTSTKEIVFADGTKKEFNHLVTTLPLPELSNILTDLPLQIKDAFSKLRFTSVFVVNLGINRDDITERHWVYYPEEKIPFFRTGFPTNFSMDVAPSGRTSLYAEISYSGDRAIDKEKAVEDTVRHLKELGIILKEKEVEVCVPIDIKYGYVLYDKNRTKATETILSYLREFNIHSIGRYGSWQYMSMEDVILQGEATAKQLKQQLDRKQDDALIPA